MKLSENKLKNHQKEMIFLEMYSLISSGLSFKKTFDLLILTENNPSIKHLLSEIFNSVINGDPLWKSMENSNCFTNLDIGVIRIGEETGKIERSLLFLSDYYKKRISQRRVIVGSISYPIIITITAILVVLFMMLVIVPMFDQVYTRMGRELPEITQIIITISKNIYWFIYIFFFISGVCIATHMYFRRNDSYQNKIGTLILKFPIAGKIVQKNFEGQFCKLLYLLCSSGVPLISGIKLIETIITFSPYKSSFIIIEKEIVMGSTLSASLQKHPLLYSIKFTSLICVGEETNKITEVLLKQSEDINSELEHNFKKLGSVLEPALILIIGSLVAFILISMYIPMFKLGSVLS